MNFNHYLSLMKRIWKTYYLFFLNNCLLGLIRLTKCTFALPNGCLLNSLCSHKLQNTFSDGVRSTEGQKLSLLLIFAHEAIATISDPAFCTQLRVTNTSAPAASWLPRASLGRKISKSTYTFIPDRKTKKEAHIQVSKTGLLRKTGKSICNKIK